MKFSVLRIACVSAGLAIVSVPSIAGDLPEGDAAKPIQVSQNTRAQVHAEAVAWVASGMSQMTSGELPFDSRGPGYEQAHYAYHQMLNVKIASNGS